MSTDSASNWDAECDYTPKRFDLARQKLISSHFCELFNLRDTQEQLYDDHGCSRGELVDCSALTDCYNFELGEIRGRLNRPVEFRFEYGELELKVYIQTASSCLNPTLLAGPSVPAAQGAAVTGTRTASGSVWVLEERAESI